MRHQIVRIKRDGSEKLFEIAGGERRLRRCGLLRCQVVGRVRLTGISLLLILLLRISGLGVLRIGVALRLRLLILLLILRLLILRLLVLWLRILRLLILRLRVPLPRVAVLLRGSGILAPGVAVGLLRSQAGRGQRQGEQRRCN